MAKRSDFAQKLLDDLRKRKERMATSQKSNQSSQISAADTYRNFKRPSQGSTGIISPSETTDSKTWNKHKLLGSEDISLAIKGPSTELVPLGGAQYSDSIADLSMVLAFALKNGGSLKKMESSNNHKMGFMHHARRYSKDISEMNRTQYFDRNQTASGRFPTLSQLHIKEISRGAQKLNQILKACSNGIDFDKYSVDIGKELLKGAVDLEESLRMLVNLQEASEHMVRPQRKQQVRLVELENDEVDAVIFEENKQKQLDQPKFSLHRHSRSSIEDNREATKNSGAHKENLHEDPGKQAPNYLKSVSHRRSASHGTEFRTITTFKSLNKVSNTANAKSEKVRIPNVIAKLMGLEELPASTKSKDMVHKKMYRHMQHNQQGTRSGKDSNRVLQASSNQVDMKTLSFEKHKMHTGSKKMMHISKSSATPDSSIIPYTDKILLTSNTTVKSSVYDKDAKNIGETNILSSLKMLTDKINTTSNSNDQLQHNTTSLVDRQEKKQINETMNLNEEKSMKRADFEESSLKDDFQRVKPQNQKNTDVVCAKEEKVATQEVAHWKERKIVNERNPVYRKHQKNPQTITSQQPNILQTSNSPGKRLQAAQKEQQNSKNNMQDNKFKGRERIPSNSSKPPFSAINSQKNPSNGNRTNSGKKTSERTSGAMPPMMPPRAGLLEDFAREGRSNNFKLNMKKSQDENLEQNSSSIEGKTAPEKVPAPVSMVKNRKPLHIPIMQKLGDELVDKSVNPRVATEKDMPKEIKKQPSVIQPNQRTNNETAVSAKASDSEQDFQKPTQNASNLSTCMDDEKLSENRLHKATLGDTIVKVSDSQEVSIISLQINDASRSSDATSVQTEGMHEGAIEGVAKSSIQEGQKIPKSETSGLLTENEVHLKQVLIKSQLFLNAAEALYRIHIPAEIFHASANNRQNEDDKLILDSAYEVMKRKGRRQELMYRFHTSIGPTRVKCLDELVKELNRDLETFKFCAGYRCNDYNAADCLHEMLLNDIENRRPDVNCMWDYGWNGTMSAFLEKEEVVRDVEKYILNLLIDEVMVDMVSISVPV
ncbi:hypothetical protein Sjap_016904 [Stephania japonica]|uniref:DUF3741 domain-containing protein n=1 Tax=Stephania japonica TaxID=461633 RepID=A0AAP0I557_9MAGN